MRLFCCWACWDCAPAARSNASGEPRPITLQADSIAVEQILAPQQIAVKGDVALILSQKTDTVFYAYGLPDFRFLYKQGVRGQGPDDFLMGSMVSCPSRSEFAYYDIYGRTVRLFELTRKGFEKKWEYRVNMRPCEVLSVVNDSIVILEKQDWNTKELGVYAYNGRSGKITDSLPGLKTYIKSTRIGYTLSTMLNRYSLQGYGEHFVVSYQLMDRIEFYRVSPQGKIELVAEVGDAELPESVKNYLKVDTENPPGGDRWKTPSLENIRFYYGKAGMRAGTMSLSWTRMDAPSNRRKRKTTILPRRRCFGCIPGMGVCSPGCACRFTMVSISCLLP